jgi:hypothetical protein
LLKTIKKVQSGSDLEEFERSIVDKALNRVVRESTAVETIYN